MDELDPDSDRFGIDYRSTLRLDLQNNLSGETVHALQYPINPGAIFLRRWLSLSCEPTVADAVCDRIVNDSYTIKNRRFYAKAHWSLRKNDRMAVSGWRVTAGDWRMAGGRLHMADDG